MRYLQTAFHSVVQVSTLAELAALKLGEPEQWLVNKLNSKETFIYIDPNHPDLRAEEDSCIEWLSSRLGTLDEPKFLRMTAEQILEKQRKTHARLAAFAQKGFRATTGAALRPVDTIGGLTCFELIAANPEFRQELMNETVMVQHCVGLFEDRVALSGGIGEHYARQAEDGNMRLYSMRTKSGNARITLSVQVQDGVSRLEQMKGKQNRPPAIQYHKAALAALQALKIPPENSHDINAVGILARDNKFVSVFDQPDAIVQTYLQRFPNLIMGIPSPTNAQLWATLPNAFELAQNFELPASLETLIAMTDPFTARRLKRFLPIHREIGLGRAQIVRNRIRAVFPSLIGVRR